MKNKNMIEKRISDLFSKIDYYFINKSNQVSNFEKVIHIFAAVCIFWLGIWKIHADMIRVLSKTSYNSDIWIEIIESLDILVFIIMVIIASLENIFKEKNYCAAMKNFIFTRKENSFYSLIVIKILLYGYMIFIIVFKYLFADTEKDYVQFFLSLSTQYYLLSTEMDFVRVIKEIKVYFRDINFLLKKLLSQPKLVWWIHVERKSR